MPHHTETRILPYRPEQLFELVASVERYPEFLPWCKAVRILARSERGLTADLIVGYKLFTEKFRSEVDLIRSRSISVKYISGPLSHLTNVWHFAYHPDGCALTYTVDFDFKTPILKMAMDMFFDKALSKMVAAFEVRAHQLYGHKTFPGQGPERGKS